MGWSWFRSLMYRQTIRCDHFRTAKIPFEKGQVTNNYRNQNLVLNHPVVGMSTVFLRIICFSRVILLGSIIQTWKYQSVSLREATVNIECRDNFQPFFNNRCDYCTRYGTVRGVRIATWCPFSWTHKQTIARWSKRIVWQGYCRQ